MKHAGTLLVSLGVAVGVAAGVWLLIGLDAVPLPLVISIMVVKHAVAGSFGLMGIGAVMWRIGRRRGSAAVSSLSGRPPERRQSRLP